MTEAQEKKATGTWQIVVAALLYALAAYALIRIPLVLASDESAAGKAGAVFGLLLWAGLGTWALIAGLNRRRASSR